MAPKHNREFEERSAGDGSIIGKKVYVPGSEEFIGIPQLASRNPGDQLWTVIVRVPEQDNPVILQLDTVLVEVLPRLDARDWAGIPADSEERQKLRERAAREGAQDLIREPGISDDEAEPELPHEGDGVDYSTLERPTTDDVRPAGKPLGRGRDTGQSDVSRSGGITQTGGSTMASVGEVKAAIDAAMKTADQAAVAARHAIETNNEAMQMLAVALEGSGHDTVAQAQQALMYANERFEEGIQSIMGAKEGAELYGAAL